MSDTSQPAGAWPNFFIVGEPRSGTTSLHTWLADLGHPDLYMSAVKEPHFFARFDMPSLERSILQTTDDEQRYLAMFADGADRRVRGESSSYYLSDPGAPAAIAERVPDAKLVAIVRNPVERAFSHYLLYGRRGVQEKTFAQTIDDILDENTSTNLAYDFVEHGRFATHLERVFENFDRSQVLVVEFDDIRFRPIETLAGVLGFLGLDTAPIEGYVPAEAQNSYAEPRNRLAATLLGSERLTRWGLRVVPRPLARRIRARMLTAGTKPVLDPATRRRLQELYAPEIDRLERMLGVEMPSLRDAPRAPAAAADE